MSENFKDTPEYRFHHSVVLLSRRLINAFKRDDIATAAVVAGQISVLIDPLFGEEHDQIK